MKRLIAVAAAIVSNFVTLKVSVAQPPPQPIFTKTEFANLAAHWQVDLNKLAEKETPPTKKWFTMAQT